MIKNIVHSQTQNVVAGLNSLELMLDLMKNKVSYDKKKKELENLIIDIQAEVLKLTKGESLASVEEVLDKKATTLQARSEALTKQERDMEQKLAQADQRAKTIESNAVARMQEARDRLENKEKELTDKLRETSEEKRKMQMQASKLKAAQDRVDELEKTLQSNITRTEDTRSEYEHKLNEFNKTFDKFQNG